MGKKVFIGVGHGGSDPGAVKNGFKEKDLNLSIALSCRDELVRHGVTVRMSREKDENDPVGDEVKECNKFAPDLAVDIHNNAGGGDGAEVFHHYGGGTGKTLAKNILSEIVAIGQNSRGAKTKKNSNGKDYHAFIRNTKAPAVIVECAFVDNAKDIQIIDTAAEQATMGVAIAKGLLKTLGVTYQERPVEDPAEKPVEKPAESMEVTLPKLCSGSEGDAVKALQAILRGYGYKLDGDASGKFGRHTMFALRLYQNKQGLPITGETDLATWTSLLGL